MLRVSEARGGSTSATRVNSDDHWSVTDVLEHTSEEVTPSRIPAGSPRRRNLQEPFSDGHGDGHTSDGDGHTSIVESYIKTFGKTCNGE